MVGVEVVGVGVGVVDINAFLPSEDIDAHSIMGSEPLMLTGTNDAHPRLTCGHRPL